MMLINMFEMLMIICFGISWPISIYKSVKSKTAKGKSLNFEIFIWCGYVCGITRKVLQVNAGSGLDWLFYLGFILYILNIVEITIDICLYFRNKKLDDLRESGAVA